LDEKWGKFSFAFWVSGFYVAFMPLYILGMGGFMRRVNHYSDTLYQPYFIVAAMGVLLIFMGIILQFIQLAVSIKNRHALRDSTGDPWHGRTLEWSTSSPAPLYNFAVLPTVQAIDQFWLDKENQQATKPIPPKEIHYQPIHMPKNTSAGFIAALFAGVVGFAIVWHMWIPGIIGFVGAISTLIARTFLTDIDYYIPAETVKRTELAHLKEMVHAS
jgi:cytochrome o ubiquinol oxidase subunit 1